MIIAIHQPAYLPWLGYLDRIAKVDQFVFLDHVQFEKNSFTNRNRIKTTQGSPLWLSVPVLHRGHTTSSLAELKIDETQSWRTKHLRSIEAAYRRTPGFNIAFPMLESWITHPTDRFSDFAFLQLCGWLQAARITTPVVRSSTLPLSERKSALVLEICRALGATRYLSGPLGRGYLDEAAFSEAGIGIEWHAFTSPRYPQQGNADFIPNLSAVDFWMNTGSLAAFSDQV